MCPVVWTQTMLLSRRDAMILSTFAGFTGVDRAYVGDYTSAIAQVLLLAVFVYADMLLDGESVVMIRLITFSAIAMWWIIDIIRMGYMVSSPGFQIANSTARWAYAEPIEKEATAIIAVLFSVLVHVVPGWAPIKMQKIKN